MTIKHTPGPWQVKPAAGGNLFICSSSRKPSTWMLTGWIADCIIDEILAEGLRNEDSL